jgi:hypothetical protein
MMGERINAYTQASPDGRPGVVVDIEGMMVDLVTFVKAMAINSVVQEDLCKARFFQALEEVWQNVQVAVSDDSTKQ